MAPLPSAWLMEVARGIVSEDGAGLVGLFENAPRTAPPSASLIARHLNAATLSSSINNSGINISDVIIDGWAAVAGGVCRWSSSQLLDSQFDVLNSLVQSFHQLFTNGNLAKWSLPILLFFNSRLMALSIKIDSTTSQSAHNNDTNNTTTSTSSSSTSPRLEEAVRTTYKAFTACITDRFSPLDRSRKWGTYAVVNLLMRAYFKLKSFNLCGNIIRALGAAAADLPDLSLFPLAHRVEYSYYMGVLAFRQENYKRAEEELLFCFEACVGGEGGDRSSSKDSEAIMRNKALILVYLIPILMLRGTLPTQHLLSSLQQSTSSSSSLSFLFSSVYTPLAQAIREGDLALFDATLYHSSSSSTTTTTSSSNTSGPLIVERVLFSWGVYLVVEKCRAVCVRTLFKKVWILMDKSNRIPFKSFRIALDLCDNNTAKTSNGNVIDAVADNVSDSSSDAMFQVECVLANMIDKGYMKGYLSHEHQIAVLSNKEAFPALHNVKY